MTAQQIAGWFLVALPFAGIAGIMIREMGVMPTLGVFGVTALMVFCIGLGVHLLHT